MKIAIDCRMIGSGGIGTYISELIPYFLKNNQCLLLGEHEQCATFLRQNDVEFCFCNIKPFSLNEMFNFPTDILNKINKCDVYYSPYCNIPNGIKIPTYSTIHDVVFLDINGLVSPLGKLARKMIYKRAINLSKTIFTVSEFSKKQIIKNLNCKKNIIVGYNGISKWASDELKRQKLAIALDDRKAAENGSTINMSSTTNADSKAFENISQNATEKENQILFVGNIKKHKGLSALLNAFLKVKTQLPHLKLIIVGNSENFRTGDEEILSKIKEIPDDSISFTGKINNKELKEQYKKSKLLIQPSFYEGFGIPPLEALFCGTNTIISDIEVFKELYSTFPVTFFTSGDSNDLAQKIIDHIDDMPPQNVPNIYSYEKTAQIILNNLL